MDRLEQKTLIHELSQGKELAKQLMSHLEPSSSQETRDLLVDRILSSIEKALSMLNHTKKESNSSESPYSSGNTSPRSVFFDQESNPREVFKKRKTVPKWTEQVKVCLGTGSEGPLDDGYNWRKYGQKDILGATHPRGYYRCTHRNSQGCLATKQVQKSEEDSSLIEVTYKGHHTCSRSSQTQLPNIASTSKLLVKQVTNVQNFPQQQEAKLLVKQVTNVQNFPQQQEAKLLIKQVTNVQNFPPQQEAKKPATPHSSLADLKAGLGVKTEGLDTREDAMILPPFSFPPTPIESDTVENPFLSPQFLSPATSESNYFAASRWCDFGAFGQGNNSESDHTEILSAPASPIGDLHFPIGNLDFELNFSFDSPEFFA